MSLISWADQYSVKIKEIDNQHTKLVDLINQLHDAMKEGKSKEIIGRIISDLVTYTKFHFFAEEKIMADNNYPGYLRHKKEHEDLTQKVIQFQSDYESGKAVLSLELMQFLKTWLVNHIMKVDKEYSVFLNSKGIN